MKATCPDFDPSVMDDGNISYWWYTGLHPAMRMGNVVVSGQATSKAMWSLLFPRTHQQENRSEKAR